MFNFLPPPFCLMETATSCKVESMELGSWRLFVLLEAVFSQLNISVLMEIHHQFLCHQSNSKTDMLGYVLPDVGYIQAER